MVDLKEMVSSGLTVAFGKWLVNKLGSRFLIEVQHLQMSVLTLYQHVMRNDFSMHHFFLLFSYQHVAHKTSEPFESKQKITETIGQLLKEDLILLTHVN